MSIKVVVDSTSYIPRDILDMYDISVVPLSVVFGESEVYKETAITNEEFYEKLNSSGVIPKSAQPSIDEVYSTFENLIKDGNNVIGVFISSDMSGTYGTAHMVKEMILQKYPQAKIELIDSRSNCMQLGYAALTAAKGAKLDKPLEEILNMVKDNIKRSRFIFTPDTLEYLKKGGRIGTAQALLGSFLQIRPILTVEDGKTDVITKVRTKKKAVESIIEMFVNDVKNYGLGEAIVHHINCEDEAKEIVERVKELLGESLNICPIGPVIGTHVGPGSLGIAYYTKKDFR